MSTLSTCMIVKNEEACLAECLECIRKFSDEIIIVDTGSTDATVEIAKKYTDQVYFFLWQDDFSLARNESYRHATSDYILWMDADNYIDQENCEKLIALKEELKDENSIFLQLYSDELGRVRADHRITRRNPKLSWSYPIHEQYPVREPVRDVDILVEHRFSGKVEPVYLNYIRSMPQEEIAAQFWFLAQCCQDFTRSGCREEAEHYREILLHKNWDWQEKVSPSIDAAHVLEYYGFYKEAMWWYDYLFQIDEFKKFDPKSYLKLCKHAVACRRNWQEQKQEQQKQEQQQQAASHLLSIIVPAYNAQDTIERSIRSVLSIREIPIELVIVDDGSTDRTQEVCRKCAREDSRIKVFRQKNQGPGAARNEGMRQISGAYVGFLDADDCYVPGVLVQAWKLLKEDQADAVNMSIRSIPQSQFPDGAGNIVGTKTEGLISGREAFRRMLGNEGIESNTYAKLYRRSLLPEDLHFYEGILGDEIPVTWRMLLASRRVYLMKEVGYLFCEDESETSLSGVRFSSYFMDMVDQAKLLYDTVLSDFPEYRAEAAEFYLNLVLQCVERIMGQADQTIYQKELKKLLLELQEHKEELKATRSIDKGRKRWLNFLLLTVKTAKKSADVPK